MGKCKMTVGYNLQLQTRNARGLKASHRFNGQKIYAYLALTFTK